MGHTWSFYTEDSQDRELQKATMCQVTPRGVLTLTLSLFCSLQTPQLLEKALPTPLQEGVNLAGWRAVGKDGEGAVFLHLAGAFVSQSDVTVGQ